MDVGKGGMFVYVFCFMFFQSSLELNDKQLDLHRFAWKHLLFC